jgi:PAS domain S-box-containing protein
MNDTLIVIDPDMRIKTVNKATCELLGYKKEEISGMDMNSIFPEAPRILGYGAAVGQIQDLTVANYGTDYVTRSGKLIPMLLSAAVLRNKDGETEGVVCIARDITELRRAEDALRQSERELDSLSTQLLTAQEKERKRLSIELHDELGQSLMVLKLKMRSILNGLRPNQDAVKGACDDALRYLNEVTENVRRLSRDLSPSILEDLGFSVAMRRLAHTFAKHSQIECSLDMVDIDGLFSAEEQIILYRMFQECLTNVAKHAQATHVSLIVREQEDSVLFCVEDNGRGFDVLEAISKSSGKRGLGLAALQQRARMLRGSVKIKSQEGTGTTVLIAVPLAVGGCAQ